MHVIFPAGPEDALALALVHVTSWRETYRGLLPDSFLDRMSVPVNTRASPSRSSASPSTKSPWPRPTVTASLATPPAGHRAPGWRGRLR